MDGIHRTPGDERANVFLEFWGYTQRRDGTTSEYEVRHPPWRYWDVARFEMDPLMGAFYGSPFTDLLAAPHSVFVAEGSEITVLAGHRLAGRADGARRC